MNVFLLGDIFLYTGAIAGSLFCLAYWVLAPWWKSEMGRHIMAFTAVISVTLDYVVYRSINRLERPQPGVRAIIFGAIAIVIVWRLWMLIRDQLLHYKGRGNRDDNGNSV